MTISITPDDRRDPAAAAPGIAWRSAPALHVSALTGIKRIAGTLHLRKAGVSPPGGGA